MIKNRIYSRFLSPDPLFEKFEGWSPYHFAFNNPVMYSDPSGLAPKKEKREAKLLNSHAEEERQIMLKMLEEMERRSLRAQGYHDAFMMESNISFNRWQDKLHPKSGGGGSDGKSKSSETPGNHFKGDGPLLSYATQGAETKTKEANETNDARGNMNANSDIPYSNQYLDWLKSNKSYTTPEVLIQGKSESPDDKYNPGKLIFENITVAEGFIIGPGSLNHEFNFDYSGHPVISIYVRNESPLGSMVRIDAGMFQQKKEFILINKFPRTFEFSTFGEYGVVWNINITSLSDAYNLYYRINASGWRWVK